VPIKPHSEVDKVSYESARKKQPDTNFGAAAFMTGLDERVHTTPYHDDGGTSRLKGKKESTHSKKTNNSGIPMNPVCEIDIK
jgi:hypothetical protein